MKGWDLKKRILKEERDKKITVLQIELMSPQIAPIRAWILSV